MIIIFIIRMAVTVFYFQLIYRIKFVFFFSLTVSRLPNEGLTRRSLLLKTEILKKVLSYSLSAFLVV